MFWFEILRKRNTFSPACIFKSSLDCQCSAEKEGSCTIATKSSSAAWGELMWPTNILGMV